MRAIVDSFARILVTLGVEISKAMRLKQTFVGPFLILMILLGGLLSQPVGRDGYQDYTYIAYVTPIALNNLGFLLLLIYAATLISSELGAGSIRQILIRPILRWEYVAAKFLLGMGYALLLSLLTGAGAWTVTYTLGDLHGITFGGELLVSPESLLLAYLGGLALGLLPLWAGVALGIAISVCTRSAVTAVSVTVGLWILIDLLKYPLGIEAYVFTTYLEGVWQVYNERCLGLDGAWTPMAYYTIGSSLAVIAVSFATAITVLERRNITA
jgi:hypothetical protein